MLQFQNKQLPLQFVALVSGLWLRIPALVIYYINITVQTFSDVSSSDIFLNPLQTNSYIQIRVQIFHFNTTTNILFNSALLSVRSLKFSFGRL